MLVLIVSCLSTNNRKIYQFNMYMLELLLQVEFVIITLIWGKYFVTYTVQLLRLTPNHYILHLHKNFIHQPNLLNSSLVGFIVYNVQTSTIKFLFNNFLVNGAKQHCMQLVKILTERHIGLRSEASSLEIKPSPFLLKPIRSYI